MKLIVNLILILVQCFLGFTASPYQHNREAKIIGGHESAPNRHPYLVSLQTRFLWIRMHVCGGSIINENWVLTAAHCITESFLLRWLPMDAIAGAHNVNDFGPKSQISTVKTRLAHPLYPGGIGPYDIGLLQMMRPFTFTDEVQPIHLPYNYKISNDSLTLAGWGVLRTTFFFPDLPSSLQEAEVTYIPYKECREAIEKVKDSEETNPLDKYANLCTGPLTGGVAACSGDSGGPLVQFVPSGMFYDLLNENYVDYDENYNERDRSYRQNKLDEDDDKIPVLLGIVSWGMEPCGDKGAPTVYTKVSNYMDFIQAYTKEIL